jgi:hypothetical protein
MLVTQTSGGLYERFFEEVGTPSGSANRSLVFEDQPGAERIIEIAAEHGIEIPLPTTQRS